MKKILYNKTIDPIDQLITKNRLLHLLHQRVLDSENYDSQLLETIKAYVALYISSRKESDLKPEKVYRNFIRAYNKDMTAFEAVGKYPLEIDENRAAPSRYEYNVILLFSCLFAAHRFRIMQLIRDTAQESTNGLFIGCGPGLEFALVKEKIAHLFAYDLTIDEFLKETHPEIQFEEKYFTGKNDPKKYDSIYLIELLEHLDKPYLLLEQCKNVLSLDGKIFLTTATNIPQFDHLYNFESDHKDFEQKVEQLGLKILLMEDIPHQSMTLDIGAKNRFYVLTK